MLSLADWYGRVRRAPNRSDLSTFGGFAVAVIVPVVSLVVYLTKLKSPGGAGPGRPLDQLADSLAGAVMHQWTRAAADRRLLQPEPIPVRWGRPVQPLAGPVSAAADSRQFSPLPGLSRVVERQLKQGGLQDLHAVYGGLGSGRMIIAGAPGSGKSGTAVLLLLAALKHRTQVPPEDRSLVPVPVLFTLHGWNPGTERIQNWLVLRLQQAYPLFGGRRGAAAALALINGGKLAVILDGLDEIPEELRPMALRSLSQQAAFRRVILTRRAEMAAAAQQSLLAGALAIELLPIDPRTAADYLTRVQLDPAPSGWRELIGRLRHGRGSPLDQALSSPLALTLVRDTYRSGDDILDLLDLCDASGHGLAPEDIEDHLLGRVLPAAYEPVPGEPRPRYQLEVAQGALGYLAAQMNDDGTRDLAWWRIPVWVPRNPRVLVTGLVVGSITGLLTGLAIGIVAGRAGVIAGTVAGHGTGLVIALVVGIGTGLVAGPGSEMVARARGRKASGSPDQLASPQWRHLAARGALGTGLVAGLAVGLGFGTGFGAGFGLVAGLSFGIGVWIVAGLVEGLSRPVEADVNPLDPLASWRADKAFGRLAGLLSGLLTGLLTGVVVGTIAGLGAAVGARAGAGKGLVAGLADGLVAGIGAALGVAFGVVLTYPATWDASLAFAQLAIGRRTPLHLMRFMEDAHQRGVLRAVGPIYQFRHARLQDRLAGQAKTAGLPGRRATQPQALRQESSGQTPYHDHLRRLGWVWAAGGLIAFSLAVVVFATPLHVTGVEISQHTQGPCGVDVTGRISTNGAPGTVSYQWVFQPQTQAPQPLSQSVIGRALNVSLPLSVQAQGHGSASQTVTLQVLNPDPRTATTTVVISC